MAAINSKKLLPGSEKKEVFLVPTKSIVPSAPKLDGVKPSEKKASKSSPEIEEKIIQVTELFNNNLLLKAADRERKRKEEERKEFEEREKKLEEKKLGKKGQQGDLVGKIPGSSLFDRLARFTGFTLLGFVFNNYSNLLPRLTALGAILKPAAEGFGYFAEGILSGTIDWIEKGYKAYDTVRDWTKKLGGENFQKLFDDFSGALNLLINGAIIAGAAGIRGGLFVPKKGILPRAIKAGESVGGGLSAAGGTAVAGARMRALQEKAKQTIGKREFARQQKTYGTRNLLGRLAASRDIREYEIEQQKRGPQKPNEISKRTQLKKKIRSRDLGTIKDALDKRKALLELADSYGEDIKRLGTVTTKKKPDPLRIYSEVKDKKPKYRKIRQSGTTLDPRKYFLTGGKPSLSFEESAKIKPYGFNSDRVFYSGPYKTGYVNFTYAGLKKRMTLSEAKYLQTMIESAEAAEIINLPQAEAQRKIANEFFKNPKKYSSQVRSFEGVGIDSESRMITRRRKLTAENVAPRGPRLPTGTTQATQSIAKGASKGAARAAASRGTRIIPFIGPLLDLAISIALGDPVDEAIVGAIGSSLGAFVGAALIGSGTFGIGAILGGAVGGFVGDLIARSLYNAAKNMFFDKKKKEIRGFAQGGVVDPRRQIKATQKKKDDYEREREPMPTPTRMGYFSEILNEIYGKTDGKVTLGIIQSASSELKKVATYSGFLASLMGGTMDLLLGQPFDGGLLRYIGKKYGRQTESAVRSAGDAVIRRLKMIYSEKTGKKLPGQPGQPEQPEQPGQPDQDITYVDPDTGIEITQTGGYGSRGGSHKGEDLAAESGTPLRAISDGEIVDSGVDPGGWGNFVVYKDANGYYHLYGHIQGGYKAGGKIKKGDIIAKVGMTGRTTGPHLHWEVGTGWTGGVIEGRIDPLSRYKLEQPFFTKKEEVDLGPQSSTKKDDIQKVAMNTSYDVVSNSVLMIKPIFQQIIA